MCIHESLDFIHCVNAKWFLIRLKVSALNRILYEEKEAKSTSTARENFTSTASDAN